MASEQQLLAALRRADAAGDSAGGQAIAREIKRVRGATATPAAPSRPTVVKALADSAAALGGALFRGAAALPDMVLDANAEIDRVEQRGVAAVGDAVLRAGGFPNAARVFSEVLTQPRSPKPFRFGNVPDMLGTPRPYGPGVEFGANVLGGSVLPFPRFAKPPLNAPRITASTGAKSTGSTALAPRVIPYARQIVADGKAAGVRVMTSDIRPPRSFVGKITQSFGERIPFAGTGGTRAAQQTERVNAVKDALRDFGGTEARGMFDDAPRAVDEIAANLAATRSAELGKLTSAKTAVIEGLPGAVAAPRAVAAIEQQIARLAGINAETYSPVIAKLNGFKAALLEGKNLSQIEGNRKLLGDMFADPSLASIKGDGQKAINAIYGPLRDDMGDFIKTTGGEATHGMWANANAKLAAMAGELDASAFKKALQTSEMTPENVGKMIFSRNRSDVARLYGNLDATGQKKMQAAVMQRAFDNAIGADTGLSVERFVNNLDTLGDTTGIVFKGADREQINGLVRLLDVTRRASAAGAAPATGVQNNMAISGFAVSSIFGGAAIPVAAVSGMFARAYESAPVRNLFIALAKTAPGSAAEVSLASRLSMSMGEMAKRSAMGVAAASAEATRKAIPRLNDNAGPALLAAREREEEQRKQQRGF